MGLPRRRSEGKVLAVFLLDDDHRVLGGGDADVGLLLVQLAVHVVVEKGLFLLLPLLGPALAAAGVFLKKTRKKEIKAK